MTPELIGILAVGATLIGLLVTFRRDARADSQALRAEFRADNQRLREEVNAGLAEVRADNQRLRTEVHADFAQVRGDLADVRKDVQALTVRVSGLEGRMSHLEGVIEGFVAGRGPRNGHDDAA